MNVLTTLAAMVVFVVLALLFGRWMMKAARGGRRAPTAEEVRQIASRQGPRVVPTANRLPTTPELEMKIASASIGDKAMWAFGLSFGALCMFSDPSILWSRFLSWPVGAGMLFLALGNAAFCWSEWRARIVASSRGIEKRVGASVEERILWKQVAQVRLMAYLTQRVTRQGMNAPTTTCVDRRAIVFLDGAGQVLMSIPEPLRPEQTYRMFLDAVPVWSDSPLTQEEVHEGRAPSPLLVPTGP